MSKLSNQAYSAPRHVVDGMAAMLANIDPTQPDEQAPNGPDLMKDRGQ